MDDLHRAADFGLRKYQSSLFETNLSSVVPYRGQKITNRQFSQSQSKDQGHSAR